MACPSPELLAALAEGRLTPVERDPHLDHLASCDDCRQTLLVLGTLNPASRARPTSRRWIPWAAAAAIVTVSLLGLFLLEKHPDLETAVRVPPRKEESLPEPGPLPKEPPAPEAKKPEASPRKEEPVPPPPKPATAPLPEVPAAPAPEKPPPTPPVPPAPEPSKPVTISVVAQLNRVEGEVAILSGAARIPARAGQELRQGEGLETRGPRSWALISYPDKTRVEIEGDTLVRELQPREQGKGLRIAVDRGAVRAEVSKQPAGQPLLLETPFGEAKVVGTILRVAVDSKATRLDVEEGKVELRTAAGKSVLVETGHGAVANAGAAPVAKRYPKDEILLAYDFEDGKRPAAISKAAVAQGPDRRLCLAVEADAGGSSRLTLADDDGLFTATGEETLSFDYWVDAQASSVNLSLWNRTQKQPIEGGVPRLTTGKWAHTALRLADVGDGHLKEGDWVVSLLLQATGAPPRKFFVDNLVISRPRSLKPKTLDLK